VTCGDAGDGPFGRRGWMAACNSAVAVAVAVAEGVCCDKAAGVGFDGVSSRYGATRCLRGSATWFVVQRCDSGGLSASSYLSQRSLCGVTSMLRPSRRGAGAVQTATSR